MLLHACLILTLLGVACKAVHLLPLDRTLVCKWSQLHPTSGDVILFSLTGLKDDILKFCFHCPFTHVGLVVLDKRNSPFVWEATPRGCRLVPLQYYRCAPNTIAVYRQLLGPRSNLQSRLESFIRRSRCLPYGHAYWRPLHNRLFPHLRIGTPVQRSSYFCTDLLADTLEHLGVLDFAASLDTPADVLPADFTEAAEHLPFTAHYSLGPEIKIVR
jgi:hypothetical protein